MIRVLQSAVLGLFALAAIVLPLHGRIAAQTPSAQVPPIPDPVAVQLDSATTAFLALDLSNATCGPEPACVATLPAVQAALGAARAAGVLVIYTNTAPARQSGDPIMADVAPASGDPVVYAGPDKFLNSNLDDMLKQAGIKTAVVTGTHANGGVLYTVMELNLRGYTVVVAQDGISSDTDFDTVLARYQLVNEPGLWNNAQNVPLKPNAVTLSRTGLITYK